MKGKEKILTMIFGIIFLISGLIRFFQVKNYNTAFTYDQARDMLDIRVLGGFKDFQVSGPTTSITGLNLGPYYYLLNLPAYWIGQGNPQALVYWNLIFFLATAVVIYRFFYKKDIIVGFFASIFFLMAPQLFGVTRYFWNANMVVNFIVFYFLALINFLEKRDKKSALIFGITSGLVIQFEAAFGSMCVAFGLMVILLGRNWKIIKNYLLGMIPWFAPQVAFEIKNKFIMSKLFIGTLTGANKILGEKIPLTEVMWTHIKTISKFFEGQFMLPFWGGLIVLLIALIIIIKNKKYRKIGTYLIGFLVFAVSYYTIIYHHELKQWYLEGIRVWYCLMMALAVGSVTKLKKLFYFFLVLFCLRSFYLTIIDQRNSYILTGGKSDDPKNLANLIENIDWVYQKMEGKGFQAYTYVPEIYDYPNQYLYWWYGIKKYKYMPTKVSYSLTEVPDYVREQNKFYEKMRMDNDGKIALIYETKDLYVGWLNQFKDYCIIEKWETGWRTTVEIRGKCSF